MVSVLADSSATSRSSADGEKSSSIGAETAAPNEQHRNPPNQVRGWIFIML